MCAPARRSRSGRWSTAWLRPSPAYDVRVEDGPALEIAARAARVGGAVALFHLPSVDFMRWKSHRDVVSGTIVAVQDAICEVLRHETPTFGILAEEGPDDEAI